MNFARTSSAPLGPCVAAAAFATILSLAGASARADGTGAGGGAGDCNQNGVPDAADLLPGGLALQSGRSFPAGEDPWAIAAGDLDGDGDQDLVTANRAGQDVSVLLNAGDASLGDPVHFQVGDAPMGVAAADLDGDEDLDLATANSGSPGISILFNDSKGAYSPQEPLDVGAVQRAVAAGDLDGDGDVELVVGANRLVVFRNDGAGRFEESNSWQMWGYFESNAVADLDLDGRLDVAAGAVYSPDLWFLFNEGNGNYVQVQSGSIREFPSPMSIGDVNGDSYLDLIHTAHGSPGEGSLYVTRNNGDRTFTDIYVDYQAGYGPEGTAAGDLDGDKDADIVAANAGSSDLSVVLSERPDHGEEPPPRIPAGDNPRAVTLSDLDGDGHLDVAVANTGSDDVSIFLGKGDGKLPSPDLFEATAKTGQFSPGVRFAFAGDFDGDSDIDIVTLSRSQGGYLRNNGNRTIGRASYMDAGGQSAAAGDLDGDGDLDFASASSFSRVYVLLNFGSGTFADAVSHEAGAEPVWVALGDLDGDGDLDIAAADRGTDAVSVLWNDGEGAFGDLRQFPAGPAPASVVTADLDGDGKPDIACANPEADEVGVLLNEGDGAFAAPASHAVGDDPRSIAAGDLDGDGDVDLATADNGSDTVSVLLNGGEAAFGPAAGLKTGRSPVLIVLGDLEGDGDLEIVAASSGSSTVSVFLNAGRGTFEPGVQFVAGTNAACAAIADLDGDGREDIISAYKEVWKNDSSRDYLAVIWNETVPPWSRDRDASGRPDECESRAVSSLAVEPDPVVIEGGARAIGFAGSLEAESLEEDLVWKGAVFENVGPGDASVLATGAKLYSDANGNGTLDAGDEELGSAAFDPATQRVAYQGLSRVLARGAPEAFLLVLDLERGTSGPVTTAAISIPETRPFLAALCLAGVLAAVLSWWTGRLRRLAWAPALLLVLLLAPPGCDGDGGGNPAPASSRTLRMELVEVEVVGLETGLASTAEGLPRTAWSFDA